VLREKHIDLCFRTRAWMKGIPDTGRFKQGTRLLTDLDPVIARIPVAPFVEHGAAWFNNAERFEQHALPVGDKIEETSDHSGVEAVRGEWKLGSITHDGRHSCVSGFLSQ
jgi:hypothetical protein